jgi:hypothetical protein
LAVAYYDFNVWTERKLRRVAGVSARCRNPERSRGTSIEKLRYLLRNPVKRGLVASPEQWRWSSFRSYFCGEIGLVKINDTSILLMRVRKPAA